jgi:two-component system response regulator NreC
MEVVGEAADGREAVAKANELRPDVILMDITMPNMDGFEATRQIKKELPSVQVLALTMHENEQYLFELLRIGAAGYILKRAGAQDLVAGIQAAHKGEAFLYSSLARALIDDYLRSKGDKEESEFGGLTSREREILKLIAEGHTNKEIADLLYLSTNTVRAHRAHIMEKLGVHDRTELVKYAIRKGLIEP